MKKIATVKSVVTKLSNQALEAATAGSAGPLYPVILPTGPVVAPKYPKTDV